jgi:hypothetical protein
MPAQSDKLAQVRSEVRSILESTPAFRAMSAPDQKALANSMVRVGSYLANDPHALAAALEQPKGQQQPAEEKKDPVGDIGMRLAEKPGQVGKDFKAGAVREGVEQFGEMVKKVDFPNFVSGLVNGVFNAVVKASMDQMKAYGELLAACAKTVDDFARDNVSDGAARDHIASRFPSAVMVDTSGSRSRLRARPGAETGELERAFPNTSIDLDDDDAEAALLQETKLQMARERQQLMATMVLLGINRIVVTNGQINAKVVFDMRADDKAARAAKASLHDERQESEIHAEHNLSVMPWGISANVDASSQSHMATVESAIEDTSESKAEVKAQLTGEVQLKFKSETFPLEKMVSAGGLALLNARSEPPGGAARPPAPPPPPPGQAPVQQAPAQSPPPAQTQQPAPR